MEASTNVVHGAELAPSAERAATDLSRYEFMSGIRHAARMLHEAERHRADSSCTAALEIEFRAGRPQSNFVAAYLRQILAEPALLEGFAATLSDVLGMDSTPTDVDCYADMKEEQVFGAVAVGAL